MVKAMKVRPCCCPYSSSLVVISVDITAQVCAADIIMPFTRRGGNFVDKLPAYRKEAGRIGTLKRPPKRAKVQVIQSLPVGSMKMLSMNVLNSKMLTRRTVSKNFFVLFRNATVM